MSTLPTDQLIVDAVAAGFSGVYVLRPYYADQGASVVNSIQALIGTPPMGDADGGAVFFNLLPYAARLKRTIPPAKLAAVREATIYPLTLNYGSGFYESEPSADAPHWGRQTDVITINNPAKAVQTTTYSTTVITGYPTNSHVNIMWPSGASTNIMVNNHGYKITRSLRLPPGNSAIKVVTDAPRVKAAPGDPRALYIGFTNSSLSSAAD